ncbi:cytochrome P450 [Actinocorallia lasiicapitis]
MAEKKRKLALERLPVGTDRDAAYAEIRDHGPVTELELGGYAVIGRQEADYVLRHPELFSSRRAYQGVGSPLPMLPIAYDPPEHTRYSRILRRFFSPRDARRLEPQVRGLAVRIIDGLATAGECEIVRDLAVPLPAEVFLTLFGLPLERRDQLIHWKDVIFGAAGIRAFDVAPEAAAVAAGELHAFLVEHVEARRAQGPGGDDLLGTLLALEGDDALTTEEILGLSFQFVLAGLDTVTSALSNSFAILAERPDLRGRLAGDLSAVPEAVEELLRVDGPIVTLPRVATQDVTLAGVAIPAGSPVAVVVAAANRDPSEHGEPDVVDLRRREAHLALGIGPHYCLGAHLARAEMRIVLEEWHRRVPEYRLADGHALSAAWPCGMVSVSAVPLVYERA